MKIKNTLICVMLSITLALVACKDDNDFVPKPTSEMVEHVSDVVGILQQDELNGGMWFIYYHVPGTIDSVIRYYPTSLSKSILNLRNEDQYGFRWVRFSGDVYENDNLNRNYICDEYYTVVLTEIEGTTRPQKF